MRLLDLQPEHSPECLGAAPAVRACVPRALSRCRSCAGAATCRRGGVQTALLSPLGEEGGSLVVGAAVPGSSFPGCSVLSPVFQVLVTAQCSCVRPTRK